MDGKKEIDLSRIVLSDEQVAAELNMSQDDIRSRDLIYAERLIKAMSMEDRMEAKDFLDIADDSIEGILNKVKEDQRALGYIVGYFG